MNGAALGNQIEERLMIQRVEVRQFHRNARCSIANRKSAIENY